MVRIVGTNLNNDKLNFIVDNSLKIYSNSSLDNLIKDPQPVVTFDLRTVKNPQATYAAGMKFLWDVVTSDSMTKSKYLNPYKTINLPNKVEYITTTGSNFTMHDVKVPF